MKVLLVIPAWYQNQPFPEKLMDTASGQTYLRKIMENVGNSKQVTRAVIATANVGLARDAKYDRLEVARVSAENMCGHDHLNELFENGWDEFDYYINLYPEEVDVDGLLLDKCIGVLEREEVSTVTIPVAEFVENVDVDSPEHVKVTVDSNMKYVTGLYRSCPPYLCYRGLGVTVYTPEILMAWHTFPFEKAIEHNLPTLKPFEGGECVSTVIVPGTPRCVNTQADYRDWVLNAEN